MVAKSSRRDVRQRRTRTSLPTAAPPPRPTLTPALAAALVFVASGAVLVLEILAVRLLAPYVGLTLETTTAIIGAALAGIAGGAAVGGWLADRTDGHRLLSRLLIGGGVLTILVVPLVRALGPSARGQGDLAALGVTLIALVPSAAVLSAVTPTVARLRLHDLEASGRTVGGISAWATAGALVGTFGTGFVLVPLMPVSTAVIGIGAILTLVGGLLGVRHGKLGLTIGLLAVLGVLLSTGLTFAIASPCDRETTYHCARIEVDPSRPSGRILVLDDGAHSYVDLNDPRYLGFAYTRWLADAIDAVAPRGRPVDALWIGGGGFTLPRWLAATHPGSRSRVIEVDGKLVQFDRQRLGLRTSRDLTVTVADGRMAIRQERSASADVVVGDAFGTEAVPWHLATTEWTGEVRRVLRPGGLYALNVVDFPPLELLRAEAATVRRQFRYVRLVTFPEPDLHPLGGNGVLLASGRPLPAAARSSAMGGATYDEADVARFIAGAQPLRDDFAPTDQLITPSSRFGSGKWH